MTLDPVELDRIERAALDGFDMPPERVLELVRALRVCSSYADGYRAGLEAAARHAEWLALKNGMISALEAQVAAAIRSLPVPG
jgi:hypothetical protein